MAILHQEHPEGIGAVKSKSWFSVPAPENYSRPSLNFPGGNAELNPPQFNSKLSSRPVSTVNLTDVRIKCFSPGRTKMMAFCPSTQLPSRS